MVPLRVGCIVVLFIAAVTRALDVSFIPNDVNAPLPLSKKYRDSLAKLCGLIRIKGSRLPPELNEKRHVLEKMCEKLAKDDANIGSVSTVWSGSTIAWTLLGLGGGYAVWNNRRAISMHLSRVFNRGGRPNEQRGEGYANTHGNEFVQTAPAAHDAAFQQQRIAEAREARLQRFAGLAASKDN